ncbi:MAG: hypothetical protein KDJ39_12455 [Gammaproteobacteria bacterium]|nr:hypothetical protein [Gammaproteobacteria bacterium]
MPSSKMGLFALLCLLVSGAGAAKVTLSPDNWGNPAGEECVSCHSKSSAGLTEQWRHSAHAKVGVNCLDCHQASTDDADAITHEGQTIATIVSPKDCGRCHAVEEQQQRGSVHAEAVAVIARRMPAMVTNLAGPAVEAAGCAQCHGSTVRVQANGELDPDTWPNSGIGRINPDRSRGSCSSCHGRHAFSKAQARKPEACVRCHSGPDSPDKEVFEASKHGMAFASHHDQMNLDAESWVAGKDYFAAPTCATCHMGAAGKLPATHDVGMRNVWNLNTPVSERQHLVVFADGGKREFPESMDAPKRGSKVPRLDGAEGDVKMVATPDRRRQAMSLVCRECHGKDFVEAFMRQFDGVVDLYNRKFGEPARAIMQALYSTGRLTPTPFDEPIEFAFWELWHDEGARARHGAAMMSPNHVWWEGMYVVARNFYGRFLPEVRAVAGDGADALIAKHVQDLPENEWLKHPERGSPLLGVGTARSAHE